MERTAIRRLQRRNVVLALLAAALAAVVLLRPEPTRGVALDDLPHLLPDLDTAAVREIEIERKDPAGGSERVRVVRRDVTTWVLPDRFDHEALPNVAERLLDALADARDRGTITDRAETFERYRPANGWKSVRLKDAAGKVLAEVALGGTERADLVVRVGPGEGSRIARVARLRASAAPTAASAWIETQLWPGTLRSASMVRLDLDRSAKGGPRITLVKRGVSAEGLGVPSPALDPDAPEKTWWLAEPAPGGEADALAVEDRGRSFTGLVAMDVVAGAAAEDPAMGFGTPELVATFHAQEGPKVVAHTLTVGARHPDKDAWYVRVGGRPFVYLVGAGHAMDSLFADVGDVTPDGTGSDAAPDDEDAGPR